MPTLDDYHHTAAVIDGTYVKYDPDDLAVDVHLDATKLHDLYPDLVDDPLAYHLRAAGVPAVFHSAVASILAANPEL